MSFRSALCAAALTLLASPVLATTVLTFDGSACSDGLCNSNGEFISQDYGDVAGQLDVSYDANRTTLADEDMTWWGSGYESLSNVAYGTSGAGGLEIRFEVSAGYQMTLNGFDIAPYANRLRDTSVRVFDLFNNTLPISDLYEPLTTAGVTSYSNLALTSTSGFSIWLGPDAWDVGIDNISFNLSAVGAAAPIPLPAGGFLLLAGLGGLALARRRNRA